MGHFSTVERSSRRELRKVVTRRELLRAGRKLFSEKGLYESRIEDLTESAGIAKGTLYLYFRNKQALVLEVTEEGYEELRNRVLRTLGAGRTSRGLVRAVVRAHLEFFAENPDLLRIFHQVRGLLKFRSAEWESLKAPLEGHIRFLADVFARTPAHARWNASERRRLAVQIYGTVSGVTSIQSVLEPSTDLRGLLPLVMGSFHPAVPRRTKRKASRPRKSRPRKSRPPKSRPRKLHPRRPRR
jgi:AcrR family transcriptional regulator